MSAPSGTRAGARAGPPQRAAGPAIPRRGGHFPGVGGLGLPNVKKLSAPLAPRPFCAYNRKQDEGVRPRARNYKCDT